MSVNALPPLDAPSPAPAPTSNASSTVRPVADYEPPAFGNPPRLASLAVPRGRSVPIHRTRLGRCERQSQAHTAATFADAALRRVLEVLDRRRPLTQLRPLLASGLADTLLAGRRHPGEAGAACLRRVIAQPASPDGTAAEVAASYTRGGRVHAIACRVEQVGTVTGPRWQVVALHLG